MTGLAAPFAMLAELTHRCPLQCPYCSNPLELERASNELTTEEWGRVIDEAAEMGMLQIHFSGGEPTVRRDLAVLVKRASEAGLYSNLITSGVLLDAARLKALADVGLEHVQLSFQDSEAQSGDRIGGLQGGHEKKVGVARLVRAAGLPLTLNLVVHRQNLDHLDDLLAMAVEMDAQRVEIAHVQYYGWALKNRRALMPTRAQLERATATVEAARERLKGVLVIDYVVPDYYARRPKACMGGWARQFLNISPSGRVLPCHAAESITSLTFDTVRERSLQDIWANSDAFNKFRGTDWMPEPCRSCNRREIDWGGCRCQAFALTGEVAATDPACALSPHHEELVRVAEAESSVAPPAFVYRRIGAA
ncbi:pyrroloquinoline quinone biosynthesis protein PqqE [Rhodospirillaceae bacterium SYSU D60014]|uniref:pyrroloquinoline quinone biosynthesis protein PqqE n=1 Tax=Virgifigura deserti TaxID=2268457 RepID=UPI000E66B9E3